MYFIQIQTIVQHICTNNNKYYNKNKYSHEISHWAVSDGLQLQIVYNFPSATLWDSVFYLFLYICEVLHLGQKPFGGQQIPCEKEAHEAKQLFSHLHAMDMCVQQALVVNLRGYEEKDWKIPLFRDEFICSVKSFSFSGERK